MAVGCGAGLGWGRDVVVGWAAAVALGAAVASRMAVGATVGVGCGCGVAVDVGTVAVGSPRVPPWAPWHPVAMSRISSSPSRLRLIRSEAPILVYHLSLLVIGSSRRDPRSWRAQVTLRSTCLAGLPLPISGSDHQVSPTQAPGPADTLSGRG